MLMRIFPEAYHGPSRKSDPWPFLEHSAFHTGHLNPFTALARRPHQRGHRVIIFGIADTEARVRVAGVEFQRVGCEDYPLGTLKQLDDKLSRLKGLEMFRFTVERVRNHSRMVLRDGPLCRQSCRG